LYGLKEEFSHKKGKIKRLALLMRHKKPQISTYQSNKGKDKRALPHHPPPPPPPPLLLQKKKKTPHKILKKKKKKKKY